MFFGSQILYYKVESLDTVVLLIKGLLHCLLILNKVLLILALHLANIDFILLLELVPGLYHHRQFLPQFMVLPLRTLQQLK